ncbi:MAG: hypothetical protein ACREPT_11270, partial [Rudaea sp.]
INELKLLVPLQGLVDYASAMARLNKEISRLRSELAKANAKLANENFVRGAPSDVVDQEKARKARFEIELARLELQLDRWKQHHPEQ